MGLRPGKARAANVGILSSGERPGFSTWVDAIYPVSFLTSSIGTTINGFRFPYQGFSVEEELDTQNCLHPNYSGGAITMYVWGLDQAGVAGTYSFDIGARFERPQTNLGAVALPDSISFVSDGTADKMYETSVSLTLQGTAAQDSYIRFRFVRTDAIDNDFEIVLVPLRYAIA